MGWNDYISCRSSRSAVINPVTELSTPLLPVVGQDFVFYFDMEDDCRAGYMPIVVYRYDRYVIVDMFSCFLKCYPSKAFSF